MKYILSVVDFLFYDWEYLNNNQSDNSYENPIEIIMDQSKTVTATFEEKLPLINPDNTDKNNTVGKWKIRKKGPGTKRLSERAVNCEVNEIIFRSDNSFIIITETSTITMIAPCLAVIDPYLAVIDPT